MGSAHLHVASQHVAFWTNSTGIHCHKGGVCCGDFLYGHKNYWRGSGRSATGVAVYHAGEKLHAIAHVAYQSSEKLQGKSGKITQDCRKKKDIVHSEILLPDNAFEEYRVRQSLWNTVEASEKHDDTQLAQEFIFALPREFDVFR
ncbi:MAG: MobA/MobL family protein [Nitrososphaerota archaeon]|nr:MobA/MobL family protein [Nitrososphaerota archaeon]